MLAAGQLFVVSIWIGLCRGYADFLYPGIRDQNLTFNYIDIVYFTWTSSIDQPWMNLWCSPGPSEPQSKDYLYHEQVPTNGTDAQSFPYSGYNKKGICHMQVESFDGNDWANTPNFNITSNDSVEPRTWGLNELGEAGGSPEPTSVQQIQALASIPASVLAAATSVLSSSATFTSSSTSALISTKTHSTPFTSLTSTTTEGSPSPSRQPTSSPSSSTNTSLSPGVKAGISIGSIISFLLLALLLVLAWNLRSRQSQRQPPKTHEKVQGNNQRLAELEAGKPSRSELDGECRPSEMQGIPKAELIGDTGALEGKNSPLTICVRR